VKEGSEQGRSGRRLLAPPSAPRAERAAAAPAAAEDIVAHSLGAPVRCILQVAAWLADFSKLFQGF